MKRRFIARLVTVVAVCALPLGPVVPATARSDENRSWTETKCELYASAWDHVGAGEGSAGISPGFVAAHDAFVASGCLRGRVCPRSDEELALADLLSLMAVAEGMTGSFLPFACDR